MERGKTNLRALIAVAGLVAMIVLTSGQQGVGGGTTGTQIGVDTGSTGTTTSTTSTTSTTGSTTSTTGSTAGDGTGQGLSCHTVLVKMEERLNALSRWVSGGTLQSAVSDRHVVRLKLKCPYVVTTTPDATGYTEETQFVMAVAVPSGTEVGDPTSLPSLTLSSAPGEACATYVYGNGSIISGVPFPVGQAADWYFYVQRGCAPGTLTGGQIKFYAYFHMSSRHWNSLLMQWENATVSNLTGWHSTTLQLDKVGLASISIDSRRVYGKANIDGELPGDPNADPSTNLFNPWVFRGGHFVGNMPYGSSKDQSGTVRTQLQLSNMDDANNYIAACLSTYAAGKRSTYSTGTIGLFRPASDDSQLSQGQNAIWTNRWNITPGGTQTAAGDYRSVPFYTVSPADADQGNYLNWQIPYASAIWKTEYGGDGSMTSMNNPQMWKYFALCQSVESGITWQYFGSQWIEGVQNEVFPLTDSRPRVWKVRAP